jgi:type I restriction enzyme R subunit
MLYEIISPDAFLRPFLDDYTTLSAIYQVVSNAYARRVYVDRAFQKKTNELVQQHIGALFAGEPTGPHVRLDPQTIETIKRQHGGKATKIVNLVKAIQKAAEENSDDPFLIAMAERAKAVQESFEDRQSGTEDTLAALLTAVERDEQRKREQAARGMEAVTFFVFATLRDHAIPHAETVSLKVGDAFAQYPNWRRSEKDLRELRNQVTFAIVASEEDLNKVTAIVDDLFTVLQKRAKT